MASYCTRCNINWARLHEQLDDERDEAYEHCPKCHTDMFLIAGRPGPQYIKDVIGGAIYNVETREELLIAPLNSHSSRETKPFDLEQWKKKRDEDTEKQNKALQVYFSLYDTQGKEAAETAYFNYLKTEL